MADYNYDESKRTEKMAKSIAVARQRMAEQAPQYNIDDDKVQSPSHYADSDIECIDAMRASMTKEAFSGYCKGNVIKYIWRFEKKGEGTRDLKKAKVYLQWLIDNEKHGINEMAAS